MVRAENGLKEIGLTLLPNTKIREHFTNRHNTEERWRPLTRQMFDTAEKLGYSPSQTPKVGDQKNCVGCGYCELGCVTGAKWIADAFIQRCLAKASPANKLSSTKSRLRRKPRQRRLSFQRGSVERVEADVVVLSAGGIGTAQILKASDLPAKDSCGSTSF